MTIQRPVPDDTWIRLGPVEVRELLPHRYPFLMVDRVAIHPDAGQPKALGWKGVTQNEPFFEGHFPNEPVMPGVLLVETIAQVAALSVLWHRRASAAGALMYLLSIDQARIRDRVVPGTLLEIYAYLERQRGRFVWFKGHIWDGDRMIAEARIASTLATLE